jgi:TPR repeat protein
MPQNGHIYVHVHTHSGQMSVHSRQKFIHNRHTYIPTYIHTYIHTYRAVKLLRVPATKGVPIAQFNLGCLHSRGLGVKRDPKTAAEWYWRAAQQGHREAQVCMHVCVCMCVCVCVCVLG